MNLEDLRVKRMTADELAAYHIRKGKTCFAVTKGGVGSPCSRWPRIGVYCRQHAKSRQHHEAVHKPTRPTETPDVEPDPILRLPGPDAVPAEPLRGGQPLSTPRVQLGAAGAAAAATAAGDNAGPATVRGGSEGGERVTTVAIRCARCRLRCLPTAQYGCNVMTNAR